MKVISVGNLWVLLGFHRGLTVNDKEYVIRTWIMSRWKTAAVYRSVPSAGIAF